MLLWFLRNVVGLDDLEAYEFVSDGNDDCGIDALYLEESSGDDDYETLVVYQSKYTLGPTNVGPNSMNGLITAAGYFRGYDSLRSFLEGRVEAQLTHLIERFGLEHKLRDGAYEAERLRVRTVFVTSGVINPQAKRLARATNSSLGPGFLNVFDLTRLGPIAESIATQEAPDETIEIPVARNDRVAFGASPNRIVMAAVRATDIVEWPGIDDRSLFELNVRRELRPNRVRAQLNAAIARPHEHKDFLAYHNGLTVVCESLSLSPRRITVNRPSVVNGAQSVVALARAADLNRLTDELVLFVKIVETKNRPNMSQQVSRRSNTQNPVNPRNLVANSGRQRRLITEFAESYTGYLYETKPDASLAPFSALRVLLGLLGPGDGHAEELE